MIKVPADRSQRNSLPAFSAVAGLAALRETAVVRIGVAVRALAEGYARVARLAIRARRVALLTLHLHVETSQRVARLGMIKLSDRDCLPVREVVALDTIRSQPPLVRIFVAGSAGPRHSQESPRQILHLDRCAFGGTNMVGAMTTIASNPGMLALQHIACKFVVERLGIPLDERKILAVMLGVAPRAFFA